MTSIEDILKEFTALMIKTPPDQTNSRRVHKWLRTKLTEVAEAAKANCLDCGNSYQEGLKTGQELGREAERRAIESKIFNIKLWAAERIYRALNPKSKMCVPNTVHEYVDREIEKLPDDKFVNESDVTTDPLTTPTEGGHKLTNDEGYCYCKHPEIHKNLAPSPVECCEKCKGVLDQPGHPHYCREPWCICHSKEK